MRTIEETSRFRRDFRREKRGIHSSYLDHLLESTVHMLANYLPLPRRFFDHPLSGSGGISATAICAGTSFSSIGRSVIIPYSLSASVCLPSLIGPKGLVGGVRRNGTA